MQRVRLAHRPALDRFDLLQQNFLLRGQDAVYAALDAENKLGVLDIIAKPDLLLIPRRP